MKTGENNTCLVLPLSPRTGADFLNPLLFLYLKIKIKDKKIKLRSFQSDIYNVKHSFHLHKKALELLPSNENKTHYGFYRCSPREERILYGFVLLF